MGDGSNVIMTAKGGRKIVRPTVNGSPLSRQLAWYTSATGTPRVAANDSTVSPLSTTTRTHHCGGPQAVVGVSAPASGKAPKPPSSAVAVLVGGGVAVASNDGTAVASTPASSPPSASVSGASALSAVTNGVGGITTSTRWPSFSLAAVSPSRPANLSCQLCQAKKARPSMTTKINSDVQLKAGRLRADGAAVAVRVAGASANVWPLFPVLSNDSPITIPAAALTSGSGLSKAFCR